MRKKHVQARKIQLHYFYRFVHCLLKYLIDPYLSERTSQTGAMKKLPARNRNMLTFCKLVKNRSTCLIRFVWTFESGYRGCQERLAGPEGQNQNLEGANNKSIQKHARPMSARKDKPKGCEKNMCRPEKSKCIILIGLSTACSSTLSTHTGRKGQAKRVR